MVILGLDLAGITGYGVMQGTGHLLNSGTWDIRPRTGESPGMRYARLRAKLRTLFEAWPILSLVIYEAAHHRGRPATEQALGCQAVVQELCAEYGFDHSSVHSSSLKKFAVGSGRADKALMVAEVRRRWGLKTRDDNEADAVLCAEYGRVEVLGQPQEVTA